MKKFLVFLLLSGVSLNYAASMSQTTGQAPLTQTTATQTSQASLTTLQQNISAIKEQATILVPKIQAAFEQNGVEKSWFNRAKTLFSDSTVMDSIKKLTTLLKDTATQGYSLLRSPNANLRAQAKSLIASLANSPEVQQLLVKAKEIPMVGGAFSYALKNFIGTAETANPTPTTTNVTEIPTE